MADFAKSTHPAVQAQLDRLALLSLGGDRLGLDRITQLLDRLGRPQDALPPVFHVAGTNGKGSTCAFLRAALEAADRTVHMFTSPHLVRFNERIRLAGRLIEDEALAALLTEVLDASDRIDPSFFEVTTAAAFLAFARTPADACIFEVGLGGRLDATNVVERPLVCGITHLAIDHQQYLGRRMVDIAGEKAGIAKAGAPLVTQLYPPAIGDRIGQIASEAGAKWLPRGGPWDATVRQGKLRYRDRAGALDLPLPRLAGRHQAMNAALSVAMLRHQDKLKVPDSAFNVAMGWADWPARMQRLGPGPLTGLLPKGSELWIDGGHNPSAARAIAAYARRHFAPDLPLVLVFASLTSKDPRGTLAPFQGLATEVHTLPIADHDFRDPGELAKLARSMGFQASAHATLDQALKSITSPARVLAFGSLYLAGEALAANGVIPD
jgi:dihydrofolate synthase/folylpolyglutamate synthase